MSLFIGLLNEKQAALHMYLNFLKARFNYTELIWIYHSLNQPYNQGKTMLLQAYMQQHVSSGRRYNDVTNPPTDLSTCSLAAIMSRFLQQTRCTV